MYNFDSEETWGKPGQRVNAISYMQSQDFRCTKVVRVRLESKPVFYSCFLSQVGPQVINPGG